MSEKIDDGGPAFPEVVTEFHGSNGDYQQDVHSVGGVSRRDYFAAKAMASHALALSNWAVSDELEWHAEVARMSFLTADAMLKASQQ